MKNQEDQDDMVTIRMSRRSVEDVLGDMEESLAMQEWGRKKNPNYPSEESMFEEFPHVREQMDAYRTALSEPAVRS